MNKSRGIKALDKLFNPRTNMDSKFRSLLFDKIREYCTSQDNLTFFGSVFSKVDAGYNTFDFCDNYSQVNQRISDIVKIEAWQDLERSEILDSFRKSNYLREYEVYLLLLAIDLSNFIVNGDWQYSEINIYSYYSYVIVFASELNLRIMNRKESLDCVVNEIKPLIKFYKKERLYEYFLQHFNSIDWYVTATIRLSREYLRYCKVNSNYQFGENISNKSYIDIPDIIVMREEMLTMLVSRIRELFLNKSDKKHSSAFSYIIKISNLVDIKINKKQLSKKFEDLSNYYKDYLNIFKIKRNKENFHITTYMPSNVFKENTIQSETTINIPEVFDILDAYVNIYENYRQIVINTLSLSRPTLPKRAKIRKTKMGDLYLKYTIK